MESTGLQPDKYVVVKTVDGALSQGLTPDSYFVIRRDDILGTATLYSYRQNIMQLLDVDTMMRNRTREEVPVLSSEERSHLEQLAEDVWGMAQRWEHDKQVKIPD